MSSLLLDKYQIIKVLGKGNFGRVVLARSEGVDVAIKQISKARLNNEKYLIPYLEGEIECMRNIKSEHVMNLVDVAEDKDYRYLICEYCNSGNLLQYQCGLPDRVVPLEKTFEIIAQVLKGLQEMHSQGYLHRDLKPENILVKKENGVQIFKIADFGFARKEQDASGTILGTGKFMAPEIYKEEKYDYGVDMWAIGVIIYFMLNSEYPFNPLPKNEIESIRKKCPFSFEENVKASSRRLVKNCNPDMEHLFKRIFAFDPHDRMNFHELKRFVYLTKYFPENKDYETSGIMYTGKFKGRNADAIHKQPSHSIEENEDHDESSAEVTSNIVPKNNFRKEIDALQFHFQHKEFLFNLSEYFRMEDRYLLQTVKFALRYNVLKFYIIEARKLRDSLKVHNIPEGVSKDLKWAQFWNSEEYRVLMKHLVEQINLAQGKFEDAYNDCKRNIKEIREKFKEFEDAFHSEVKETAFEEFKKSFRAVTSGANKTLSNVQNQYTQAKKDAPKLIELRIRVFICHILNQVFNREDLRENFSYYFEWKKRHEKFKVNEEFNFEQLSIWISKDEKASLVKTINIIFKKYFG